MCRNIVLNVKHILQSNGTGQSQQNTQMQSSNQQSHKVNRSRSGRNRNGRQQGATQHNTAERSNLHHTQSQQLPASSASSLMSLPGYPGIVQHSPVHAFQLGPLTPGYMLPAPHQ